MLSYVILVFIGKLSLGITMYHQSLSHLYVSDTGFNSLAFNLEIPAIFSCTYPRKIPDFIKN